jgi:alpha-tubulin suppressor-like RCC1 family protein
MDTSHPGQFIPFDYFTSITTGGDFACGLGYTGPPGVPGESGALWCWGLNDAGQLGINCLPLYCLEAIAPQLVIGGGQFKVVDAGAYAVCGSKKFNSSGPSFGTYCWGRTAFGQAGDGGTQFAAYLEPTEMLGLHTFDSLAHGWGHVCGLSPQLYCWGFNNAGQLGDGTHTDRASATFISAAPALVALTAGTYHTCGLTSQGQAFCWGGNDNGQLGMGTYGGDRTVPTAVPTKLRFTAITAGAFHTCALVKSGAAYCWGYGGTGEIGDGTFNSTNTPTAVSGGQKFSSISAGDDGHNCAITSTQMYLFCWGNNDSGQIGNGAVGGNVNVPTRVLDGP